MMIIKIDIHSIVLTLKMMSIKMTQHCPNIENAMITKNNIHNIATTL